VQRVTDANVRTVVALEGAPLAPPVVIVEKYAHVLGHRPRACAAGQAQRALFRRVEALKEGKPTARRDLAGPPRRSVEHGKATVLAVGVVPRVEGRSGRRNAVVKRGPDGAVRRAASGRGALA
jgi:hypothetical protein